MAKTQVGLNKKKVLSLFLITAAVLLVIALVVREDLAGMFSILTTADYRLVALTFGVYMLFILLWAGRWRVSLGAMGHRVSLWGLYLVTFSGRFINNITPFTYAGGDPISRAYLLNKVQEVPYPTGFASTVIEYMLDFPVFLSFLLMGLAMSFEISTSMVLLALGVWIVIAGSLALVLHGVLKKDRTPGKSERIIVWLLKIFRKRYSKVRVKREIDKFGEAIRLVFGQRKSVVRVVLFSIFIWILNVSMLFLIFQALGYHPPLPMLLLGITLPAIVGMVPLAPGGLGTVDAAMALVFMTFGTPEGIVFSAVLLRRLIVYVFATIVGGCTLSYLGIRIWKK